MKKEPIDIESLKKEAARRMKGLPPSTGIDTIVRPMLKEFWSLSLRVRRMPTWSKSVARATAETASFARQ